MKKYFIAIALIAIAILSFWFAREHRQGQVAGISIIYDNSKQAISEQENLPATTTPSGGIDFFVCPENTSSPQDYVNSLAQFMSDYIKTNSNVTVYDAEVARYNQLVAHSCDTTLAYMNRDVDPTEDILRFNGESFGPQDTEFTPDTKVWSSYFPLSGQGLNNSDNPDEELVLNFYLKNVWKNQAPSVADVAGTVVDGFSQGDGVSRIIDKFTTPDLITGKPAYFIFADTLYPDQNYGYVDIIKISSIQTSVFSVLYAKKFTGDQKSVQISIDDWLAQDLKSATGISTDIGNIGVDDGWISYLQSQQ